MMNASKQKYRVKGFTLVEMIVVIAIIIALLGVFAPAMNTYYRNSRIRAANSDAKMVYNTVQTEVMHYMSRDRRTPDYTNSSHFGAKPGAADSGKFWITYDPTNGTRYKINGGAYAAADGTGDSADAAAASKAAHDVAAKVNRLVSGASDVCWAVYIDNYIVEASVSANDVNNRCIGFYSANKQQAEKYHDAAYSASFEALLTQTSAKYKQNPQGDNTQKTDNGQSTASEN